MEMQDKKVEVRETLLDNDEEKNTKPILGKQSYFARKMQNFFVYENAEIAENDTSGSDDNRMRWDSYAEYFLSIIGFVIDLGNVWRFPTVCYMNGGGAFLVPFFICLFLIGMPCMYLELAVGQYFQLGNVSIWAKLSPYMKGIGYSVILINVLMLSYYNTLQAYAFYYLVNSFRFSGVPWSSCDQPWSTDQCQKSLTFNQSDISNGSDVYLASSEFFRRKVLGVHHSTGFDDLVGMKFDLLACLLFIFCLTTFCLIGGIKTSGKAVYITALLPYVCLIVLITQSLTLDGAWNGLAYLKPNFSRLYEIEVWLAAAIQIFFSLGPGFGVLITYASYTPKSTRIRNVTLSCAVVNCVTSLMYGLVVFSGLGYMAKRLNVEIDYFLQDGIGLVFIVYPEILATFKYAGLFAIVFFVMLILLGMDSAFGGMEGLYTGVIDEFAICKRNPFKTRMAISIIPFITALPTVTYGGIYSVQWLDRFAISPAIIIIVLVEVITVCWIYGSDRFHQNIKSMNGSIPYINWRISWKYIVPILLAAIIIFDAIMFTPMSYGSYIYPMWSNWLGYFTNFIVLLPIPFFALYTLFYPKCISR